MLLNLKLKYILLLLGLGVLAIDTPALAQVTPDGSTPTTVTTEGNNNVIQDGRVVGDNLFHSFSDFSLPNGGEAAFNNAATIENIISRVTGGRISDINGIIRANGGANLFLINPAGILFRDGARLQIGGSFLGSTADSIVFPDDIEFGTDDLATPLLTVNAPVGLGLRDNPAPIEVRGANLRVAPDRNLTLVGGNIDFAGGLLVARNGRVSLGGLSTAGIVDLNEDLSLNFREDLALADISLSDNAIIEVSQIGEGAIALDGNNISFSENSALLAGVDADSTTEVTPGNIAIAATGDLTLNGNSIIRNNVANGSTGDAGNINLSAANIFLNGNSRISSTVNGNGNTAGVIVTSGDRLELSGSEINSRVAQDGEGNSGNLQITANTVSLGNSSIFAQTQGTGNAGSLTINEADTITLVDSQFQSQVAPGGVGNGNDITINTTNLTLDNARVLADSNGIGNAGNVFITATQDVTLDNDTIILSKVSEGEGDAGNVNISAARLLLDGRSFIISNTGDVDLTLTNTGNAGNVIIDAPTVALDNFSQITSNSLSNADGQPGNIDLTTNNLTIAGGSNINALTENSFNGGEVAIAANNIGLSTGGKIVTSTNSGGNGGSIILDVAEGIVINGDSAPTQSEPFTEQILQDLEPETGLFANATATATGNGGNIEINRSGAIDLVNGATISVASQGLGNGGDLLLQTQDLTLDNGGIVEAFTNSGEGGNITLQVADLILMRNNGNTISARASNDANGGNVTIDTNFIVALPNQNNDIVADAATGNGGEINISAEALLGIEERASQPLNSTNDIDASSEFGLDGNVSITNPDVDRTRGAVELDSRVIEPQASVSQVCSADSIATGSSLSIQGKGGIPREPSEPFVADSIIAVQDSQANTNTPQGKGILTAQGYIYPARSVSIGDNGEIVLHRNAPLASRDLAKSRNCL